MSQPEDISRSWALGPKIDAQNQSFVSLTQDQAVTIVGKDGETQGNMSTTRTGKVAWPVDPVLHGGASAVACDACFAEFIASEQKAYLLDDIGVRHSGAKPLEVGNNLILPNAINKDSFVIVIRTAEFGTDGMDKNVAFAVAPKSGGGGPTFELIAHHLSPSPNDNSSEVFDPDGNGRKAKIDDQWRIRVYNPTNARAEDQVGVSWPPQQFPPAPKDTFAVMINGAESGVGENRGHFLVHFATGEARMANTADGPFRPSSKKHKQAETTEGDIHAGAIGISAFYTNGSETYDSPLDFELTEEPDVQEGSGMPTRVHLMMDTDKDHDSILGKREGFWRWHVKIPLVKTPPCKDDYANPTMITTGPGASERPPAMIGSPTASPVYTIEPVMNVGGDYIPMPGIHKLAR